MTSYKFLSVACLLFNMADIFINLILWFLKIKLMILCRVDTQDLNHKKLINKGVLGGGYMIPFCREEILSRFAGIPAV